MINEIATILGQTGIGVAPAVAIACSWYHLWRNSKANCRKIDRLLSKVDKMSGDISRTENAAQLMESNITLRIENLERHVFNKVTTP